MDQNQYTIFKELDRAYVAGGFGDLDTKRIVTQKRESIESLISQSNPLVQSVLAGNDSFAKSYHSFSHSFRGYRRFLPRRDDPLSNERLQNLAKVVPNVIHLKRRSLFAADNPITCIVYAVLFSFVAGGLWIQTLSDSGEKVSYATFVFSQAQFFLSISCALGGLVMGAVAMLRYRTRNMKQIHAREAAMYMDLNYSFYRSNDDEGWSRLIDSEKAP